MITDSNVPGNACPECGNDEYLEITHEGNGCKAYRCMECGLAMTSDEAGISDKEEVE